jgi:Na+-translocating ferredoxin:NAD+ oxidoreductase RnfG subunit
MQLRLRTKLTLVMTGLVLLVVAAVCTVLVAQLLDQVLQQTDKRAQEIASQVFVQAHRAVLNAPNEGVRPESTSPRDVHNYVRHAFEIDEGLRAQLSAAKRTFSIDEV